MTALRGLVALVALWRTAGAAEATVRTVACGPEEPAGHGQVDPGSMCGGPCESHSASYPNGWCTVVHPHSGWGCCPPPPPPPPPPQFDSRICHNYTETSVDGGTHWNPLGWEDFDRGSGFESTIVRGEKRCARYPLFEGLGSIPSEKHNVLITVKPSGELADSTLTIFSADASTELWHNDDHWFDDDQIYGSQLIVPFDAFTHGVLIVVEGWTPFHEGSFRITTTLTTTAPSPPLPASAWDKLQCEANLNLDAVKQAKTEVYSSMNEEMQVVAEKFENVRHAHVSLQAAVAAVERKNQTLQDKKSDLNDAERALEDAEAQRDTARADYTSCVRDHQPSDCDDFSLRAFYIEKNEQYVRAENDVQDATDAVSVAEAVLQEAVEGSARVDGLRSLKALLWQAMEEEQSAEASTADAIDSHGRRNGIGTMDAFFDALSQYSDNVDQCDRLDVLAAKTDTDHRRLAVAGPKIQTRQLSEQNVPEVQFRRLSEATAQCSQDERRHLRTNVVSAGSNILKKMSQVLSSDSSEAVVEVLCGSSDIHTKSLEALMNDLAAAVRDYVAAGEEADSRRRELDTTHSTWVQSNSTYNDKVRAREIARVALDSCDIMDIHAWSEANDALDQAQSEEDDAKRNLDHKRGDVDDAQQALDTAEQDQIAKAETMQASKINQKEGLRLAMDDFRQCVADEEAALSAYDSWTAECFGREEQHLDSHHLDSTSLQEVTVDTWTEHDTLTGIGAALSSSSFFSSSKATAGWLAGCGLLAATIIVARNKRASQSPLMEPLESLV